MPEALTHLVAGMAVPYGGDRVVRVTQELADAFVAGDRLVVVQATGALLHVPAAAVTLVDEAVAAARQAFAELGAVGDSAISAFFAAFARRLADDALFAEIAEANAIDVAAARARARSTTRLALDSSMREAMARGLEAWRDASGGRGGVVERIAHTGWTVEQERAPLGVVGFVFEGRPNVFADATGVLRSGNTVVFRIGSDALGTARAITRCALVPALADAGLPPGAVQLLDSPSRATGWALFSHPDLALAVARGSGEAVAELGAVARQAGVPVSLHGTGGAWMVAGVGVDPARLASVLYHSLDRKVCNTTNVCCALESHAATIVPVVLAALDRAADRRGVAPKLHATSAAAAFVPPEWFERTVTIRRPSGDVAEPQAELIDTEELGEEWEWEDSPELSLVVVASVAEAVSLFNRLSPRLAASLVSDDAREQSAFWAAVDAPFVGDGFTRWVDGQFAFDRPELGLSNWEHGRLFARSAVLSGDSVFTVRTRVRQHDPDLHR